jgi:hypothetical protein
MTLIANMARAAALSLLVCAAAVPFSSSAFAHSSPAVGTYSVADTGAGGAWQGGPLFANGTLGGGGNVEFPPSDGGQFILKIVPLSWGYTDQTDTSVVLCFDFTELKPQRESLGDGCTPPLPVTDGTVRMIDPGTGVTAEIHVSFHN